MIDGTDLVTKEDVTDPGGEDVVVLGEGDVLSDDEGKDDSDAAEYVALGDGALPRSVTFGDGEATQGESVAVASDDALAGDVGVVAAVSADGHSVLQL